VREPDGAELIAGVRSALRADVLPALADGAAQRQLKAALVILGRLERSWGRLPAYLDAEAADIEATLGSVLRAVAAVDDGALAEPFAEALAAAAAAPEPADRDERLQALLATVDARLRETDDPRAERALAELMRLYRRMVDRQAAAWATAPA
jgi:hypothetical protein